MDQVPVADPNAAADPDPDPAMAECWEQLQVSGRMDTTHMLSVRAACEADALL